MVMNITESLERETSPSTRRPAAGEGWSFTENHDMGGNEVVNDKMLGYSFILTQDGYPCVFWTFPNASVVTPKLRGGISLHPVKNKARGSQRSRLPCSHRKVETYLNLSDDAPSPAQQLVFSRTIRCVRQRRV